MNQPRLLTKSRLQLGLTCPTKLFYTNKPEYANASIDDTFLEALADGGFQVGELAKCYYPDGHTVSAINYDEALAETNKLLEQENVTIFEAAIQYKNLFIRVDILVKTGNHIELIEVKSKSYDSNKPFFGTRGKLGSTWLPYIYDVAFQHYVLSQAFPTATISPFLMLADKTSKCATDGLNQKFQLRRDENNRKGIAIHSSLTEDDIKHQILVKVPADDAIEAVTSLLIGHRTFEEHIIYLADSYANDNKIITPIGRTCKQCEFKCTTDGELNDGFVECWTQDKQWLSSVDNTILDVWNMNYRTRDKLFARNILKIVDIEDTDLNIKESKIAGLTTTERQWLQIEKVQNNDTSIYFDVPNMKAELEELTYPLHFIDFETAMAAIPFNKGRTPYEGIAFQFSHHTYHEDGTIEHTGEYINVKNGAFPNFDFVRELKRQLEQDSGSIFIYSKHENSYLNMIMKQMDAEEYQADDFDELKTFIMSITHSSSSAKEKWHGERDMVDMLELVKKYYFDPVTKGSNSLKDVFPAIINSSTFLQEKYSKPIYGGTDGIPSNNFTDWTLIKTDGDTVINPYTSLPKMFTDISDDDMDRLTTNESIDNGGAAMTAYAKIQYTDMTDVERQELIAALLRYCELDTFAMVMLFEAWKDMCK